MSSRNIRREDEEKALDKNRLFETLSHFFSLFKDNGSVGQLKNTFLSTTENITSPHGLDERIEDITTLYENAVSLLECDAARNGYPDPLLLLQSGLYRELEKLISHTRCDDRHHFLIVIPVADRPLMLENCLTSLKEQCRLFGYGGMSEGPDGPVFTKVSVFIFDDSRNARHRKKIRKISSEAQSSGIRTFYIGLNEQTSLLDRLPLEKRRVCSTLIGQYRNGVRPHKGASLTRNIAYLYLYAVLSRMKEKVLIYFIDSDEEFRIATTHGGIIKDIPFINYFYWLNRIFTRTDVEVATGKVVGDPPVSPAVMVNTLLDDLSSFLEVLSSSDMHHPCIFHGVSSSEPFCAEYHDMAHLFGYKKQTAPGKYICDLNGTHTHGDCFENVSNRVAGFFYGLHPTRTQFYTHRGPFTQIEAARTVYTGNYIFNRKGFRHFIPFASLNLRMAGPALGRILRARLGKRFASAPVPVLHRRTISLEHTDEYRSGISTKHDSIDVSGEFMRQFWGDVMLFSIDTLTSSGFPIQKIAFPKIIDTVSSVREDLWRLYNEQQGQIDNKIARIKNELAEPSHWWNRRAEMKDAVNTFRLFFSDLESNFGLNSTSMKQLSEQIADGSPASRIIEAINSFYEDEQCWNELLKAELGVSRI